ncbi:16836_t:CDS:1 [Cetraspora pellucida]|uniref:16836_t:CDS:1 n=1 Tax=Cetraspora pellucida TaxID=1433469 RepID=A0A9N9NNS6_9GLOM|nr:16836_t:CDS:1 [Cetraspora pellucida]
MDTYSSDELDISANIYSSDEFDIKRRQNNYHVEGEAGSSMNTNRSNELNIISRQDDDLIFDNQEGVNESNMTFNTQSIAGESNLVYNDQKVINEFNPISNESGEIFGENILESDKIISEADEFQYYNSEYSDNNEIDSSDFPSAAY